MIGITLRLAPILSFVDSRHQRVLWCPVTFISDEFCEGVHHAALFQLSPAGRTAGSLCIVAVASRRDFFRRSDAQERLSHHDIGLSLLVYRIDTGLNNSWRFHPLRYAG